MAKKLGDSKSTTPMTLEELSLDMAHSLDKRDERFDRFWNFQPFPKMIAPQSKGDTGLAGSDKKIQVVFGSNRSGKSFWSALIAIAVYTGIVPPALEKCWYFAEQIKRLSSGPKARARNVRIIVMDYSKHWPMVIKPMLLGETYGMLPDAWSNFSNSDHIFTGPDGSKLDIYSADPAERSEHGDRKLRGAPIDLTWVDEINRQDVYTESISRLNLGHDVNDIAPDSPSMTILSYCPQEGYGCWTFAQFFKACYEMKGDKAFRKAFELCSQDIYALHVSMKDNPLISQEEYERQCRLYKPWEKAYRVDGWYSNRAENPYFDIETLLTWEREDRVSAGVPFIVEEVDVRPEEGKFVGRLKKMRESDVEKGSIYDEEIYPIWRIWETPIEGEKYLMSADVAAGNPKSDPQSVSVWKCTDKTRIKQVAQLHMVRIKPGELAQQSCCMGYIYGNCVLVPERNNDPGGTFADRARYYSNLYKEITIEKDTEETTEKIGWRTTGSNKGAVLESAYKAISLMSADMIPKCGSDGKVVFENWCPFSSRATLQEFIGFEERIDIDKKGFGKTIWSAKRGDHDDTVMEACIGFRIINHQYGIISPCKFPEAMKQSVVDRHYLGEKKEKKTRSFANWKKQPSLQELRNRHGRQ